MEAPSDPMGAPMFEHNVIVCVGNILMERVRLRFPAGHGLADPQNVVSAVSEAELGPHSCPGAGPATAALRVLDPKDAAPPVSRSNILRPAEAREYTCQSDAST